MDVVLLTVILMPLLDRVTASLAALSEIVSTPLLKVVSAAWAAVIMANKNPAKKKALRARLKGANRVVLINIEFFGAACAAENKPDSE